MYDKLFEWHFETQFAVEHGIITETCYLQAEVTASLVACWHKEGPAYENEETIESTFMYEAYTFVK